MELQNQPNKAEGDLLESQEANDNEQLISLPELQKQYPRISPDSRQPHTIETNSKNGFIMPHDSVEDNMKQKEEVEIKPNGQSNGQPCNSRQSFNQKLNTIPQTELETKNFCTSSARPMSDDKNLLRSIPSFKSNGIAIDQTGMLFSHNFFSQVTQKNSFPKNYVWV